MKSRDKTVATKATRSMFIAAEECISTLLDFERWALLAWTDIRLRYRRTVLGPWWATLTTGTMIVSVGLVFGAIFGDELSKYLPFLAAGVIVWTFINGSLLEGCGVFAQAGGLIKSIPAPAALHVFRMFGRQLIVLAHHFVIVVLVWLIFRWDVDWGMLLAVPGMVLVCLALIGAVLGLAILCARFRDIQQIVATVLQLLFLLTPIVWMPGSLRAPQAQLLLYGNPLYHLIEVVRGPLLGDPPAVQIWFGAIMSTVLALGAGLALYGKFRNRVPYWV